MIGSLDQFIEVNKNSFGKYSRLNNEEEVSKADVSVSKIKRRGQSAF